MQRIKRRRIIKYRGVPLREVSEPVPTKKKATRRKAYLTPDGCTNEVYAAQYLNLAVSTLQNLRSLRKPPKYFKRGTRVFYRMEDLEEYASAKAIK